MSLIEAMKQALEFFEDEYPNSPLTAKVRLALVKQIEKQAAAGWQPIETAPEDNKTPLLLARFNDDGTMQSFDYDGVWKSDCESWEMPEAYWYWASANGYVEEPSHWMYQPEWFDRIAVTLEPKL